MTAEEKEEVTDEEFNKLMAEIEAEEEAEAKRAEEKILEEEKAEETEKHVVRIKKIYKCPHCNEELDAITIKYRGGQVEGRYCKKCGKAYYNY